jgi:hypothetical protein
LKNTANANNTSGQKETVNPDALKAACIMTFPEFIEWPSHSTVSEPSSPFVIGVLGDTPIFSILESRSKKHTIRNKKVKVIAINDYSQINNCNALFISTLSRKKLKQLLQEIDNLPILTIGDTKNYERRGVMINFFILGNHAKFNVNCAAAKKCGLRITSRIVRYAKTRIN